MEQTLTDSLGNTIVFKYDETLDSVFVKNSTVSGEFMEVIKNIDSDVINFDVIMIPEFLEYDTWSDDATRGSLRLFWDEHKVNGK
jgi:UDP-glucose 6-dehydrogenase